MTSENATVDLYQPLPAVGVPNASPFCVKLETWLRLSGIPYRVHPVFDPRKGPRGKIPWLRLAGENIADSDLIIDRLAAANPDLSDKLRYCSPAEHLVVRTLEESLYWALVFSRWQSDAGFETIREPFFGRVPAPFRPFAVAMVRRQVRKQLWQQGTGRFTEDEVLERARRDLEAVASALGEKPFFAGTAPGRVDASAYGFLTNIVDSVPPAPLKRVGDRYSRLADFTARMREAVGFS